MVFHIATGVLLFLSVAIPHPNQDCRLMAQLFDCDAPLPLWAFTRGSERLIMDRVATAAILLTFSGAASQVIRFDNPTDAAFFQGDLETELVRTGWRLAIFETGPAAEPQYSPYVTFMMMA